MCCSNRLLLLLSHLSAIKVPLRRFNLHTVAIEVYFVAFILRWKRQNP